MLLELLSFPYVTPLRRRCVQVGVTPFMWLFVVFFVIFDIPQGHIIFWLPDIFVMVSGNAAPHAEREETRS